MPRSLDSVNVPAKVLVVVGQLSVGGTEVQLLNVLPKIDRAKFTIAIVVLHGGGSLVSAMRSSGVSVYEPPWRARGFVGIVLAALCLIYRFYVVRPDITHFFLPEAYLVGALCGLLSPCGAQVMSRRSLNVYQIKRPLLARFERRLHGRMDAVLGNCKAVIAELESEGIPADKITLLYNGVEPRLLRETLPQPRQALGVSETSLIMICVANLISYKGHRDIFDALADFAPALPDEWDLLCVGRDDGIGRQLQSYCNEQGLSSRVHWLGVRDDIPELLAISDIGISASHEEGLSNSVLECMAAGLPIVATDVGGNPEIVEHKRNGLLIPKCDPKRLGQAVCELADNPSQRKEMARVGQRTVREKFSLQNCVQGYEDFYAGVLTPQIRRHSSAVRRIRS